MQYIEYNLKFFEKKLRYFEKLNKNKKVKFENVH